MKLNKSVILGFLILIGIFYVLNTLFHRKRKKFNYSIIEGIVTTSDGSEKDSQTAYGNGNNIQATANNEEKGDKIRNTLIKQKAMFDPDNVEDSNKVGGVKNVKIHIDAKTSTTTETKYKQPPPNPTTTQREDCKKLHNLYIYGENEEKSGQVRKGKKKDLCDNLKQSCGICYDTNNHKIEILPTGGGGAMDIDASCNPDAGKIWNNLSNDSNDGQCKKILDRQSCSNVSSCYELNNEDKDTSNCAWCPIKGKAYVYDKDKLDKGKTKGQYHPKYPNDDICKYPEKFPWLGWTNTPLLKTQDQCDKIYKDHQCFNTKDDKGKNIFKSTPGCKKQIWKDYGFSPGVYYKDHKKNILEKGGKLRDEMLKIDNDLSEVKNFSDMTTIMQELKKKSKNTTIESFIEGNNESSYSKAKIMGPVLYNKEEYSCDWYEKKKKAEPNLQIPYECKLEKWNKSNCGEQGLYHPKNINQNADFLLNSSIPFIVKKSNKYCDATNSMKKVSKEDCKTFANDINKNKSMDSISLNYLPHGCIYYEDPLVPDDNRILWNNNTNYNPTTKKEINKSKYARNDICRSSRRSCYREGATRVCQSISKDDIDKLSPAELEAYYKSIHNKANKNNRPNINPMKNPEQTDKDIYWQKACYGKIQDNTSLNISKNKQCMNDYRFKLKSFDVDNLYDESEKDIGMKVYDVNIKENFDTINPIYTKNSFKLNTMNKDNEITRKMYGEGGGVRMFNTNVNDYPYWKLDKKVNEFWKTENGWFVFKKLMEELSKYYSSGDIIAEEENIIIIDDKVINLTNVFRDYNIPKPMPFKKTGNFLCRNNRNGILKSIRVNKNNDKKKNIKKAYDFCKNQPRYNKSFTYYDLERIHKWYPYDYYLCSNITSSECVKSFGYGIAESYDMGTSGLIAVNPKKNYITKSSYFNGYKKPGDTEFSTFPFHAFMEIIRQKLPKEKVNEIMKIKLPPKKEYITTTNGTYDREIDINDCKKYAESINYQFKGGDRYKHPRETPGCFTWRNSVYFNNNRGSKGKCDYRPGILKCIKNK